MTQASDRTREWLMRGRPISRGSSLKTTHVNAAALAERMKSDPFYGQRQRITRSVIEQTGHKARDVNVTVSEFSIEVCIPRGGKTKKVYYKKA